MLLEKISIDTSLRLGIILGSTRKGRFGETVANWFEEIAKQDYRFETDLIDLSQFSLPWDMSKDMDSDLPLFSDKIAEADVFVVITPEYNHGYPAYLKLAIDSLHEEWNAKPVGFVSYGGSSGGLRAVEQLRNVFAELRMTTIRDCVSFHWAHARFHNGRPTEEFRYTSSAERLLNELYWWGNVLKQARMNFPRSVLRS
ncbi:NADPH-dependent FMN reductase [Leptospira licerasiae]|uniref:NADPH-dependent FMN reductase n=1 Tax=Leptospira licerasiae TaxID=447106 RepID=UPI001083EB9B|nr:NAD(P)H-dependent oxidoreductase [Leptospira licerasiae]TGM86730.1 NADPH-dependent oxidoreductase [Leptospira licerasiae]